MTVENKSLNCEKVNWKKASAVYCQITQQDSVYTMIFIYILGNRKTDANEFVKPKSRGNGTV